MQFASLLFLALTFQFSLQDCPEQLSDNGYNVIWRKSHLASNVTSEPLCYHDNNLVTRACNGTHWTPSLDELDSCQPTSKTPDSSACPPGYYPISENNFDYCYEIGEPDVWDYPCLKSGGATVITDFSIKDIDYLTKSLESRNVSKYFWLPAYRPKILTPIVWTIPGPHWRRPISETNQYSISTSVWNNCLLLDIEKHIIVTEACSNIYPSLCFYLNEMNNRAKCPNGYHTFRFMHDDGTCFGIEYSDNDIGLNFVKFLENKCDKPMGDSKHTEIAKYLFIKIADSQKMSKNDWCWFDTASNKYTNTNQSVVSLFSAEMYVGVINNRGTLALMNKNVALSCMACESEVIYLESEMVIEYNANDERIYLTVYYPPGLWKYNINDKGIQCFTNAKGFNQVIEVNKLSFINATIKGNMSFSNMEKATYEMNLVTDRSGQYWCEAHTKKLNLIKTNKIVVNPKGNNAHVFSLVIKSYFSENQNFEEYIDHITIKVAEILKVEKVLLMDVLEYMSEYLMILLHLHTSISNIYENENENLLLTYENLKNWAEQSLTQHNFTFVNISSSLYCLPTMTNDYFTLDWKLTPIKHIAAPKQFCLQANGLPVKRSCLGSYLLGGYWGNVEGTCNKNYTPSSTTSYLYNFVKGDVSENSTSRFLTEGLNFVLKDTSLLIPADIFYLSMSLQHFIDIAQDNTTHVDMGDIENIAWAMNKIMELDCSYLRLAQTLNSTNVILDSINAIIEKLAQKENTSNAIARYNLNDNFYEISIQPQFVVQISYPAFNNITGIALTRITESDLLSDMMIQPLYKNTTLEEVLSMPGIEIATWLPEIVVNSVHKHVNDTTQTDEDDIHIVISIFNKDVVFQELDRHTISHVINSRIIGVSLPGYITNLQYSIPLVFRQFQNEEQNNYCGYWDFQSNCSENNLGVWSKTGCYLVRSLDNITVCECYHLTHFAQLLKIKPRSNNTDATLDIHTKVLNVISLVGSFLSLIGIVIIWITALVFTSWRRKAGTKVLLQLTTAIAVPLVIIAVFALDESIIVDYNGNYVVVSQNMKCVCILLGSLLHYSILASFLWMLIAAILQFVRYVRVLGVCRPARFMLKFAIIGWGIPLVPVAISLILNAENYLPNTQINSGICYPSGYYMLFGLITPICLILVVNIILFILVMNAISRGPDGKIRVTDADLIGAQIRLSILLFFLLGLTWVFGIFSFTHSFIWSYLFCLTSTLQGFVLFIYFVVCDPHTRGLWLTLIKPQFDSRSRNSDVSLSSG